MAAPGESKAPKCEDAAVQARVAAGNAAYVDDDFAGAVAAYSAALEAVAGGPPAVTAGLLVLRAQAHIAREDYMNGVADASRAVELDPQLAKAYLRKGVACFRLEEYETAKAAFLTGMALGDAQEPYKTWIRKCDAELEEEDGDFALPLPSTAAPGKAEAAGMPAEAARPAPASAPPPPAAVASALPPVAAPAAPPVASSSAAAPPLAPSAPTPEPEPERKYRHQWYQTANAVSLSIMAKGVKRERAQVRITARTVSVHIQAPDSEELEYALDLTLAGAVDAEGSKVEYLSTKIEIRLPKADSTGNWPALEATAAAAAALPSAGAARPAYPSSAAPGRRQPKDWDKIETEVEEEEKEEKLEGDAALQKLFRQIYSSADEDTRRAMNKSFQESNGTVLSTNWNEIGAKKVECTPPTGMKVKKYEI